jgi:hypothetical protein
MLVDHSTARPSQANESKGDPPDLHLHSHLWLANMGVCSDGRIRAINDRAIKRELRTVEAAVQAEFSRLIEDRLGWRIDYRTDQRGETRWQVAGVDERLVEAHSSRSAEVAALSRSFEQRYGRPPLPSELRDQARIYRRAKDPNHDHDNAPLIAEYQAAAARDGIPLPEFRPVSKRAPLAEREAELTRRLMAPPGLCREDALFYRQSVEPTVLRCASGLGLSPDELADYTHRLVRSGELTVERRVGDGRGADGPSRFDLFCTREVKAKEAVIVDRLVGKAMTDSPAPEPRAIERAIARAEHPLDEEQRAAVGAACSARAFTVIEGWAGTGKSTTLRTAVDAYAGRGTGTPPVADHVYAVACAGLAAQGTAERIGAEAGHTIESFCGAVERGRIQPTERSVLVVDEYITVDTFRMARLVEAAGPARIICVGDERQAQGIGASGWQLDVRNVLEPAGMGPVTLTHVHRQAEESDRVMLAQLRQGDAAAALAGLERRGRLHVADDPARADGEVIATYRRLRDEGRAVTDVFVNTDTSNVRVDTYNRLIQDDRIRRGEISTGRRVDYLSTDAKRHESFYVGDRVAFIAGITEGRTRVPNGAAGDVTAIDEKRRPVTVNLDRGGSIMVPVPAQAPTVPIRLAYAGHVAKTQGAEAPVVLAVPGYVHSSLESAYSALTRGSEEIHVFVDHATHGADPVATLAGRWQAPEPKQTATAQSRTYQSPSYGARGARPTGWARSGVHGPGRVRIEDRPSGPGIDPPPPMTRAQASYLAALSEHAGVPVDNGLTVAEASERIENLAGGRRHPVLPERHRSSRPGRTGREPMTGAQASLLLRLSDRAGVSFEGGLTSTEAAERIASLMGKPGTERISDTERFPAQRPPAQRIPTGERVPSGDYIPRGAEIRRQEEDLARRQLEREERVLTGTEIRASEEAGREARAKEQEASRQADREAEHGRRLERIRRRWW